MEALFPSRHHIIVNNQRLNRIDASFFTGSGQTLKFLQAAERDAFDAPDEM